MYNCILGSVMKPPNTSFDLPPSNYLSTFYMLPFTHIPHRTITNSNFDVYFEPTTKELKLLKVYNFHSLKKMSISYYSELFICYQNYGSFHI